MGIFYTFLLTEWYNDPTDFYGGFNHAKNHRSAPRAVLSSLTRLAIPIMATSLIQMAYNLTDMIWIGRVGSNAVAAVGAAGMYMWLSNGLVALARMGGQVNVGYALGAGQKETAGESASGALWLCVLMGVIYGLGCALFASPLIGFFHLNSPVVISDARIYLQITCGLVLFSFLNQTFTGLFTAIGNSRAAFLSTASGLLINFVLDPVLTFGLLADFPGWALWAPPWPLYSPRLLSPLCSLHSR